jgi:hypothetical protein
MRTLIRATCLLAILLDIAASAQRVSPAAPAPNRTITAPGLQRPPVDHPGNAAGTIEGFVYWDASHFSHVPAGSCSGLAVTVSVGSSSGGPLTAYTPLGTLSNNFKYVGQVKEFLAGGKVNVYDVCTYGYDQVPVGPDLQVKLTVTQPGAFSPVAVPQVATLGPIKIINGQCNMLPRVANPTASDLFAHWSSCQNMAYDVNFAMHMAPRNPNADGGGGSITVFSGSPQGMLSGAPQQGMLASGTTQSGRPPAVQPSSSAGVSERAPTARRHVVAALSAPKQGPKITNPKAASHDATIIAVLSKQSQAAAREAADMKLGIRPLGVQVGGGPSQTMKSTGAGGVSMTTQPVVSGAAGNKGASPAHPYLGVSGVLPPQYHNLAVTCSHDPSLRVLTVSGGPAPAIFTPDPQYNFYTLTGCSFGSLGTNSKVYLYYQGTFRKDFQIQEWTDNWIKVSLDPNISGVDDQNNVTLVLQRDDGKQWSKSGYKFYAARQTVLLARIPRAHFSLDRLRPDNAVAQNWKVSYTSPSSPSVVPNLAGPSAEVHWDITRDPNGRLVGGNDLYDFGQLHSTFVLDSTSLKWLDLACTGPDYQLAASSDNWAIDWYGDTGIRVTWQGQVCKPTPGSCGGGWPVHTDCFEGEPESNYGINVWVTGPRGLDPWTGKPSS